MQPEQQEKWGVVGATGQTGSTIVDAILRAGFACRVIGREEHVLAEKFASRNVEIRTWDPAGNAGVSDAFAGVDRIIYLVGVPYNRFDLHPVFMKNALDAAEKAGVRHLLLVSSVYSYGAPETIYVNEQHPRNPTTFKGKMRKAQEDLVLERSTPSGTVLRASDFFGPHVPLGIINDLFVAAKKKGRANVLGPIDTPHQFVYVPDIGDIAVRLIREPRAFGRAWNFSGSGVVSQRILGREIFRRAGAVPKYLVVNESLLRIMGVFDSTMRELVEMSYLQRTPILLDDSALRELLPGIQTTPYPRAIENTLAALQTVV